MKINTFLLLAALIGAGSLAPVSAQHDDCAFEKQQLEFMRSHPLASMHKNDPSRHIQRLRSADSYHKGQYVIPVVFHVFGEPTNDSRLKVTYSLIEKALKQTSADFQGLSADYDQTGASSRFETIKKPLNVDFRLAKIDPDGLPTKGVIFYNEALAGLGNGSGYDEIIQKYAWDNSKYMNVYVMRDLYADGDLYNSGVSWLPDNYMSENNLARVVYNGSYIGSNTDENFRRVLSHEFGHFLGLQHTFEGGCTYPNDDIADTPPVAESKWPADKVNCEGNYTDWENFMNYTSAYRHFTAGQVERMEYYLNESLARNGLWQDANLAVTGVSNGYVEKPAVIVVKGKNFSEVIDNNGEVEGSLQLEAIAGMTFAKTGELQQGTDYTISELPAGISASVTVASDMTAIVKLSGSAASHLKADSKTGLSLVLNSSVLHIDGATPAAQTVKFGIDFLDPYTSYCMFSPRYAPYAHISKVKFAQIERNTKFDGEQYKDFRKDYVAGVEKGKTYQLQVTVQNWKSGEADPYTVRAWFDWNGNYVLESGEMIAPQNISRIGKAGSEHILTFDITVPDNMVADQETGFRVMLHFTQGKDGADPCGQIDSGDVEDYGIVLGEAKAHVLDPDGPKEPQTELCQPVFSYRPYAFISKVEFANLANESAGVAGNTPSIEDFTKESNLVAKIEKGKEYEMKVTCSNLDSSPDDPYIVRAYIDWNHDNVLDKSESQKIAIPAIGTDPVTVKFTWKAPDDAVSGENLHMRVFMHFGKESSMDGEEPCGTVENGQLEEYFTTVASSGSGVATIENDASRLVAYPNPTTGVINIKNADGCAFSLYRVDGCLMQNGKVTDSRIDISLQPKGMYILKLQYKNSIAQKIVVLQ